MLNLTLAQKALVCFSKCSLHHKGFKIFDLQSRVRTSEEKPNTTKESLELTIV